MTGRFENADKLRLKLQKENDELKQIQKDAKNVSGQSEKIVAELNGKILQMQEQLKNDAQTAADKLAAVEKQLQEKNIQIQQEAAQVQDGLKNTNKQLTDKIALLQTQLDESKALLKKNEDNGQLKELQLIKRELQDKEKQIAELEQNLTGAIQDKHMAGEEIRKLKKDLLTAQAV